MYCEGVAPYRALRSRLRDMPTDTADGGGQLKMDQEEGHYWRTRLHSILDAYYARDALTKEELITQLAELVIEMTGGLIRQILSSEG